MQAKSARGHSARAALPVGCRSPPFRMPYRGRGASSLTALPSGFWATVAKGLMAAIVASSLFLTASSSLGSAATPTNADVVQQGSASMGCGRGRLPGALKRGTTETRTLVSGTNHGSYQLTVPRSYRPGHRTPLILLFYGFGSNPTQFSALTTFPSQGSDSGYLVAVPSAQGGEWQFTRGGTDAAFVNALVQNLDATYCVNQREVFATGFSAGAAFTILYACSHQNQVTAIATVAVDFQLGCTRPIPIMAFHGTRDPLVPYQNGAVGLSLPGTKVRGTELNMSDWARLDRCRSAPSTKQIGTQVKRQVWTACTRGTAVELYSIIGGGHAWPGANPKDAIGLTTQQVSATKEILGFFNRWRTPSGQRA